MIQEDLVRSLHRCSSVIVSVQCHHQFSLALRVLAMDKVV